uniref:Uncharacterized protein n=1 Tax=Ciona savignyi TaxID=51511 RepID=H2ZK81_CIOSA
MKRRISRTQTINKFESEICILEKKFEKLTIKRRQRQCNSERTISGNISCVKEVIGK